MKTSKRYSAILRIGILILFSFPVHASIQLHTFFRFGPATWESPDGRLLLATDGNFYGTLYDHKLGYNVRYGAVYKISRTGELIWKFRFNGKDGSQPGGGLIEDAQGFLYGTTTEGGKYDNGTVFKMDRRGTLIWSSSMDGTNGSIPSGGLVWGPNNLLYGATPRGGEFDVGSIFSVTSAGAIDITHIFDRINGAVPWGDLLWASDGCLYGCTIDDGSEGWLDYDCGKIFRITPTNSFETFYMFDGRTNSAGERLDGELPQGSMLQLGDTFYGVTSSSIFKINAGGMLTTLHLFTGYIGDTEIGEPNAPLIQAYDGSLYGTAISGGPHGVGAVFKISTNGAYTTLFTFSGTNGAYPISGLIRGRDGAFYGTTQGARPEFLPTIFKLTISRPVLSVTSPHNGATLRRANISLVGRTRSRAPVENVYYQLNGNDWTTATSTNAWTNWNASIILNPGPNVIRSFAIDDTGDWSRTNITRVFLHLPSPAR